MIMEIKTKIKEFIRRYVQKDYSDDDNFFQMGYVNSLFTMQLILFIENEFYIRINNEELKIENFCTINQIVKFINNKQNNKECL